MISFGGLFENIAAPDSLQAAMWRAARGKRHHPAVARFIENSDSELRQLRDELLGGEYRPSRYAQFPILDPKPRLISCADFRDRVVHHSLCAHIGPCLERRFIADTYACRIGKGCHRAVLRAQELCRRHRYCLKLDVAKYYDSIRHDILLGLLNRTFREQRLRSLLEMIVRHPLPGQTEGAGVPIGNLTSQWFANVYLDELDHLAHEQWGCGGYVRYMDDMVFWCDAKERLWSVRGRVERFLAEERGLRIKPGCLPPTPVTEGLPFLGMRVYRGLLRLQHQRLWRTRRRIRFMERNVRSGVSTMEELARSARACAGIVEIFCLRGALTSA